MPDYESQEFLFQRIKEQLPVNASLVETVAEILHISTDSAYRRIRSETPVILDEAKILCQHYNLSLDKLLQIESNSTLFKHVRIDIKNYQYQQYLQDMGKKLQYVNSFKNKELIYRTKDIHFFHNFYFHPLIAFRYFFWMKSIIQHPDFIEKEFELNCVSPEIENLSRRILAEYNTIPSIEIWNTECINAVITQIEFYKDSGYFVSNKDIWTVYEALEETFVHLKKVVEYGCKFMPAENPEAKTPNLKFFYNRAMLADNTVLINTDQGKTAFINYDGLNYLQSSDQTFCNLLEEDLHKQMKRATIISQTSEKQRNIFFGILLTKIQDRKKRLSL
jgi:hypothetical protein